MRQRIVAAICLLALTVPAVPARADEQTVTCESRNFRYSYCRADTDNRVTLVRQRSSTRCRQYDNWGYDNRGVWVDRGCAAEFRVGRWGGSGNKDAAIAGAAVAGIAIAAAIAAHKDRDNHVDSVPSWAIGTFRGYDEVERSDVELTIQPGGSVTGLAAGSSFSGRWEGNAPARALVVNFSSPTSLGAMYLVANKAAAAASKTRQDFDKADVRLVVYKGSSQEGIAARVFPKATLVRIEGDADPVAAMIDGKAHAMLVTTPTPKLVVSQAPDKLFQPFEEPLQITSAAMAVRKGDADFLNFLDSWVAFQREGGWLADRQTYWFKTTDWLKQM